MLSSIQHFREELSITILGHSSQLPFVHKSPKLEFWQAQRKFSQHQHRPTTRTAFDQTIRKQNQSFFLSGLRSGFLQIAFHTIARTEQFDDFFSSPNLAKFSGNRLREANRHSQKTARKDENTKKEEPTEMRFASAFAKRRLCLLV